jgi:hypothetical protein
VQIRSFVAAFATQPHESVMVHRLLSLFTDILQCKEVIKILPLQATFVN